MSTILTPVQGPGYVQPTDSNNELNDVALYRFLQAMIVGVTGLPAQMVRPRWQPEPPNQPDFNENWAAVGEISRSRDDVAYVVHSGADQSDTISRNQIIEVMASFYGPDSQLYNERLVMGLALAQNREAMLLNNFGFIALEDSVNAPALLKDRWVPGVDTRFRIRREQIYTYEVPNVTTVKSELITDTGLTEPLTVK